MLIRLNKSYEVSFNDRELTEIIIALRTAINAPSTGNSMKESFERMAEDLQSFKDHS